MLILFLLHQLDPPGWQSGSQTARHRSGGTAHPHSILTTGVTSQRQADLDATAGAGF
jgi:hypothetical protein